MDTRDDITKHELLVRPGRFFLNIKGFREKFTKKYSRQYCSTNRSLSCGWQ